MGLAQINHDYIVLHPLSRDTFNSHYSNSMSVTVNEIYEYMGEHLIHLSVIIG